MNPIVGWALAGVALVAGWTNYGWQGVALVGSGIVFWLLLQFSRAIRAMKKASSSPKGYVASAVMLNAKLKPGLTMMQIITMTQSLGIRVRESPETWTWTDTGNSRVTVVFAGGKVKSWDLFRPAPEPDAPTDGVSDVLTGTAAEAQTPPPPSP